MLGGTAVAGAAVFSGGAAYLEFGGTQSGDEGKKHEVKPGDLDEYYAFNSSGLPGEVRIQALPSGESLCEFRYSTGTAQPVGD